MHHLLTNKNFHGAAVKLDHGIRLLEAFPPTCHGLDIARLRRDATVARQQLLELGAARLDEFPKSLVPRMHHAEGDAVTHSRITGAIRLLLAVLLMGTAVRTLADPQQAVIEQGMPMSTLLPVAGLSFAFGAFLLSGFMTRIIGLLLVGLGVWQIASFGFSLLPAIEAVGGHLPGPPRRRRMGHGHLRPENAGPRPPARRPELTS